MKREIKFRAWIHAYCGGGIPQECYESMDTSENIGSLAEFFELYPQSMFDIMQYTGLKDKAGCEIYEGDIIAVDLYDWIVEWDNDEAMFWLRKDERWNTLSITRTEEFLIIGNIHENPELIQ